MGCRSLTAIAMVGVFWLAPRPLEAWGTDGHREITARAIDGLPAELRALLASDRTFIAEHSVDPDLWRILDLRGTLGAEGANHFLEMDALGEPAPYGKVPRDYVAFRTRYGASRVADLGRLPWRIEELFNKLVSAFRQVRLARSPAYRGDAPFLIAVLAHYLEDACVPFHAVQNHDGQLSGQQGIHARFETELVRRYGPTLRLKPVTVQRVTDVKEFVFETLTESARLAPRVLEADRQAAGGRAQYNDRYYAGFVSRAQPVLEARLSAAAGAVASVIAAAWRQSE